MLALTLLSACWGRNIPYEGGVADTDTGVAATACGDDVDRSVGFTLEGSSRDLGTDAPLAGGLCIQAVDPTPAITGGEPTVLATAEVCDDGAFVVAGITEAPAVGMFLVVDDCDGAADTMMKTATGISAAQLAGLGDGDTLSGIDLLGVSQEWLGIEQTDLERVGYADSLATDGYMAGIVEDAQRAPVSGAVVSGGGQLVYYEDADGSDGIYGVDTTPNTLTDAAAGGLFLIPKASIFTYTCDDGGAHTWPGTLLGSLPGYAVYIRFTAQ